MNSVFWITPFQVNYEHIIYLLDTAGDSALQQGTHERYTNGEYINTLVIVDTTNFDVFPQEIQNQMHSVAVSLSLDKLIFTFL